MYSRSFNNIHQIPPDYGGVAMRSEAEKQPPAEIPNTKTDTYPRYPVYENREFSENKAQTPEKNENTNRKEEETAQLFSCHQPNSPDKDHIPSPAKSEKRLSVEDILLSGLILLLMNEKNKDELLLLILGFLLLMGNKL